MDNKKRICHCNTSENNTSEKTNKISKIEVTKMQVLPRSTNKNLSAGAIKALTIRNN